MALPNPGMDAVPFTPLTAEFLDDMIENIESLSDGTGFQNGAITTNTLAESAVTFSKTSGIWCEELGRTKLNAPNSTISVASLPARRYLRILTTGSANGGTLQIGVRFNNDSSTIYNFGYLTGTGSSGAIGTQSSLAVTAVIIASGTWNVVADIVNSSNLNKQMLADASHDITNIGNGYAPGYQKTFGKWVNTSSQITRVDLVIYSGTGNFATNSELVVLGHD